MEHGNNHDCKCFRPEEALNYTTLDRVVPNFEGKRVRFVYDNSLVKDLIVLQYLIPYFVERTPTYIVLYSEALYSKFKRRIAGILDVKPELRDAIDRLMVIKIGRVEDTSFGSLAWFIEQSDFEEEFESLLLCLRKIRPNSTLILYGSVEYYLTGLGRNIFRKLVDLFSVLPEELTLFGFRHKTSVSSPEITLLGDLYDVIVEIWKDEWLFDNLTYCFRVECQCRGGVKHGKLRIRDGVLEPVI